jgi:glyoxylase-like metal-dependent hydrolase (beta-lactamase superfamily II)
MEKGMKPLHRNDLYTWSVFNENQDIDFHSIAWIRSGGNVLIDPLPLSVHDRQHLEQLGGAAWVLITNSDHTRAAEKIADHFRAQLVGPAAERHNFALPCERWLADGETLVSGLMALEMQGSKTPGELALVLEGRTLITGDLVRSHRAGWLQILADAKLKDRKAAVASARRLLDLRDIEAVLVGDGWSVFRDGHARLREMVDSLGD